MSPIDDIQPPEGSYYIMSAFGDGVRVHTNVGLPATPEAQVELMALAPLVVMHIAEKLAESGFLCGHAHCIELTIAEAIMHHASDAVEAHEGGDRPDRGRTQ